MAIFGRGVRCGGEDQDSVYGAVGKEERVKGSKGVGDGLWLMLVL